MNQNPEGIWIIDAEGKTSYASQRMAEILGVSPLELIGQPSFLYVFPEDVDAARRLFDAKASGDVNPFDFKLRRADGSAIWVKVQGTPLHDAAGAFTGIVGTFKVSN